MGYYCGIEIFEKLAIGNCKVMVASVKWLANSDMLDASLKMLSSYRREKTLRYRHDKGRMLSAGAGLLLDFMLREQGLQERDMCYVEGEHGKPAFAGHPELHFNLSHSDTLVACALSDRSVGVDVQHLVELHEGVMRYTMSDEEFAHIETLETLEDKKRYFAQLWALKESYTKATGRGLSHNFPSFNVSSDNTITPLSPLPYPASFMLVNLPDAVMAVSLLNTSDYAISG